MSDAEIAIVGAGMAGLSCARALTAAGRSVRVFDKARRPGGRMSTRRTEDGLTFDHGAQYFTTRDPVFFEEVQHWAQAGVVGEWHASIAIAEGGTVTPEEQRTRRWTGRPTMSAVARHLEAGLDVRTGIRVGAAAHDESGWSLQTEDGDTLGRFPNLVIAIPSSQAVALLGDSPTLAQRAADVVMDPCWAVMVRFEEHPPIPAAGLFVHGSPLGWAAHDGSKPGRATASTWVLHAVPSWTREHWEAAPEWVIAELVRALEAATGIALPEVALASAHRWRYARADAPTAETVLTDESRGLAVCGDWCGGPRVEGAWRSGRAAAAWLSEKIGPPVN